MEVHELELRISRETKDSTLSDLIYKGEPLCFILEDGYREEKEMHKTRIPAGRYEIKRRYSGRHFARYKPEHGHEHTFQIMNVPKFDWIMIHILNTVEQTSGCPGVGYGVGRDRRKNYTVTYSKLAYLDIYDVLTQMTAHGDRCFINVIRVRS